MKKTLLAILCASTLSSCAEKPGREEINRGEKATPQQGTTSSLDNTVITPSSVLFRPSYSSKSFKDLLAEPTLTIEDFVGLVQYVKTPADLEMVIKTRNIHYAKKGTEALRESLDEVYGPPLQTHNLGSGVCDELAMYSLPFLLNMPEVKNITLVEINSPKKADSDELPSVVVVQDRRGSWHYKEENRISKEGYKNQHAAALAELGQLKYTLSGKVTSAPADDQSNAIGTVLTQNYKRAVVMKVECDNIIKEEALHALVVFQDKKDQWHYYSNGEFSTKTYRSGGEATTAVAIGIGYLHPESLSSIKTREITLQGAWIYNRDEAKKLRPAEDLCLP